MRVFIFSRSPLLSLARRLAQLRKDIGTPTPACGASLERDAILPTAGVVTRVEHGDGATLLRRQPGMVHSKGLWPSETTAAIGVVVGAKTSELCADKISEILMCQTSHGKLQRSKRYSSIE